MTIAEGRPTTKRMSLEDYLSYDSGTDQNRYELWDGVLIEMSAESDINVVIGSFLLVVFAQIVPYYCVRRGTEIVVEGSYANTRLPDLVVVTEVGASALINQKRSMVSITMPAPALVVEVVSSSDTDKTSRDRDYIDKRREYASRGISEYWIVDPIAQAVFVLTLEGNSYQERKFAGEERLVSIEFPEVELSANQILNAGR